MIHLYRDPFDATDREEHAHVGPLIDWLDREFPAGFGLRHQTRVNGELLPVADYDRHIDAHDRVDVVLYPAEFITATMIAQAIVGALISAAISYAANALFGAKPSKSPALTRGSTPAADRVNSLGVPTNVARLGEPIPVQYGRLRYTPDLASEPYRWYSGNDQYIGVILCLGHGQFTVHDVLISDTPIGQLAAGVGAYWQFHAPGSMGVIEAATGLYEDVEASVEVSDQQLDEPSGIDLYTQGTALVRPYLATPAASSIVIRTTSVPSVLRTWVGDAVTVTEYRLSYDTTLTGLDGDATSTSEATWLLTAPSGGGTVTGSIDISTITGIDLTPPTVAIDGEAYEVVQTFTGTVSAVTTESVTIGSTSASPTLGAALYSIERDAGGVQVSRRTMSVVGPFAAVGPGRKARAVQIDIEMPGGLYEVEDSTGGLRTAEVGLAVTLYEMDDDGVVGAEIFTYTEAITGATNTPQRYTFTYTVATAQRCAVTVERTNDPSDRVQDQSAAYWTQLRGIRENTAGSVYGDVTMVAVKLKASDGISSSAANLISVDATRTLTGGSANPAIALVDAWTSTVYGGRRSLSELDTDAVDAMETAATGANGFNYRFTAQRSLWAAMQSIIRPINYYPVPLGAQISVAADAASSTDVLAFTTANMTDVTRLCQWDRADETDGFEVTYTDPTTGTDAVTYFPVSTADPESVTLEGCTDSDTADSFAEGLWNRQQYRREYLTWTTELGGHLAPIGRRVGVTYPLVGTASYVVQSVEPQDDNRVRITGWRYDARQYA